MYKYECMNIAKKKYGICEHVNMAKKKYEYVNM